MTIPTLHARLAQGRWFTLTLPEQLGNIGSEYERAWSWKNRNHPGHFQKAFERMLELIDLTLSDSRWRNHRLKELARLREEACRLLEPSDPSSDLRKYFFQYAALARKNSNLEFKK